MHIFVEKNNFSIISTKSEQWNWKVAIYNFGSVFSMYQGIIMKADPFFWSL